MSRKSFVIMLIVYLILILIVSSIPGRSVPKIYIWSFDKILHIVEFFILAFIAFNAIKTDNIFIILIVITIGIGYGALIELWQGGVVTGRIASVYDGIANGIGMIIGSLVTYKYLRFSHD